MGEKSARIPERGSGVEKRRECKIATAFWTEIGRDLVVVDSPQKIHVSHVAEIAQSPRFLQTIISLLGAGQQPR